MKYFQISESDLETLEQQLPELMDFSTTAPVWSERNDIQEGWDMVRVIVSKVRWNYGPPTQVKTKRME